MNIEQATHDEEYGTAVPFACHTYYVYRKQQCYGTNLQTYTGVLVVRSNLQTDSLLAVDYLLYFVFRHS